MLDSKIFDPNLKSKAVCLKQIIQDCLTCSILILQVDLLKYMNNLVYNSNSLTTTIVLLVPGPFTITPLIVIMDFSIFEFWTSPLSLAGFLYVSPSLEVNVIHLYLQYQFFGDLVKMPYWPILILVFMIYHGSRKYRKFYVNLQHFS